MSWRVVFTGAIALLLAVVVGGLALVLRETYPLLSAVSVVADIGIIVGGFKTVLDTTKTANELRKMGYEVEKLKLEIAEKKQAAQKENSRIVVATLDEIQTYSQRIVFPVAAGRRGSAIYAGSTLLVMITVTGLVGSVVRLGNQPTPVSNAEVASPPSRTQLPSVPDAPTRSPSSIGDEGRKLELSIAELGDEAVVENDYWEKNQRGLAKGEPLRSDIDAELRAMNLNLAKARIAWRHGQYNEAADFVKRTDKSMKRLKALDKTAR